MKPLAVALLALALFGLPGCPGGDPAPPDAGPDAADASDGADLDPGDGDRDDGDGPAGCQRDLDCDDGDPCNGAEECQAGECFAGVPPNCDDQNPCTSDGCVARVGCRNEPVAGACDDGDACTLDDRCQSGQCYGLPADADEDGHVAARCGGADCDDQDPAVNPNAFEGPTGAPACSDGIDNDCDGASDAAEPTCAACLGPADCDDGDACNGAEDCQAGECYPGDPLTCSDGEPCTDDWCDPVQGCRSAANELPCDDGDACTLGDRCAAGACQPGQQRDCSDGNPCTDDDCVTGQGCVHVPNAAPCDDGDPQTTGDACIDGTCNGIPDPYAEFEGLTGQALRQALAVHLADHESVSYDTARWEIFSDLDNQAGQVECVYTGVRVTTDDIPPADQMNTEHTWPRSWGADSGPVLSDLNHLFPTMAQANSTRSNLAFGDVVQADWSWGGSLRGYNAIGSLVFEPRDAHKGNAARAIFYVAVCYGFEVFPTQEAVLRAWHTQDPPDAAELERADRIEQIQGTRNPFVDRPDFVDRIYDF